MFERLQRLNEWR